MAIVSDLIDFCEKIATLANPCSHRLRLTVALC